MNVCIENDKYDMISSFIMVFLQRIIARFSYLTIIPRARVGSESIAHEAEGRMGY